jgi:hypothetical protein
VAEIVNLRRLRKRKARDDAASKADANRAKFGRTKAEKARDEKKAAHLKRTVDHSKLDEK